MTERLDDESYIPSLLPLQPKGDPLPPQLVREALLVSYNSQQRQLVNHNETGRDEKDSFSLVYL